MQTSTKNHIKKIVKDYTQQFPAEFEAVKNSIAEHRKMAVDEFASTTNHSRALHEMPETLYTMLVMQLDEGEMQEFKSIKGSRWFARAFPVFALPNSI